MLIYYFFQSKLWRKGQFTGKTTNMRDVSSSSISKLNPNVQKSKVNHRRCLHFRIFNLNQERKINFIELMAYQIDFMVTPPPLETFVFGMKIRREKFSSCLKVLEKKGGTLISVFNRLLVR